MLKRIVVYVRPSLLRNYSYDDVPKECRQELFIYILLLQF